MVDINRDRLIVARRSALKIMTGTGELLWVASEGSGNNPMAKRFGILSAVKLLSDTLDEGDTAITSAVPDLLPFAREFTIKSFESFTPAHLLAWEYACRVWDCVNGIIEDRVVNSLHGYAPRKSDFEFLRQRGTTFHLPEQSLKQDFRDVTAALQERFDAGDPRRIAAEVQREHARAIQHWRRAPQDDKKKKQKTMQNGVRQPTKKEIMVSQVRDATGIENQTELTAMMTERGIPMSQGTVSRALNHFETFKAAGGIIPPLPGMEPMEHQSEPITFVDPGVLDLCERQDGLTPRQRESFTPEDD